MKTLMTTVALGALLVFPSGGLVFAGQPSQECAEDSSQAPGNSGNLNNTGSPFHEATDPDPGGKAGQVYAGSDQFVARETPASDKAVSQYDVACFRGPQKSQQPPQ